MVLVRDVLPTRVSNTPARSPRSNRQSKIARVALDTTAANNSGKTVGPCNLLGTNLVIKDFQVYVFTCADRALLAKIMFIGGSLIVPTDNQGRC